jgi:PKD repeat protein
MPSYYTVYLNVTDSTGSIVDSNTATVTVNPPLSVHILPASITTDVDQPQLFTSNVSEGTSPYTYQWYLNDSAVSNATNATWTFTPTSAGDYTVYVNVTDAAGVQATSNTATITVSPVIPEFPSYLILPLFMMITLLAAFALKRERNIRKCARQDAHGIQHYTNPV